MLAEWLTPVLSWTGFSLLELLLIIIGLIVIFKD